MSKIYRLLRYEWPLHFSLLFTNWLPDNVVLMNFRGWLASFFIRECGKGFCLGRNVVFYNPSNIYIGKNVYIAYNCWLAAGSKIIICDKVSIGPGVIFASGSHALSGGNFADKVNFENEDINIGYGSWIGGNVNLAGGTNIGKSSIIASGCSVKGVFEDGVLIATERAKVKKKLI